MTYLVRSLTLLATFSPILVADNVLHPGTPILDRPTITVLGIKLPITGDDNFNATVSVQYRISGTQSWSNALPLFRVHPETVAGYTVAPQFGGSIFDLRPATTYDIQLHAVDPDGADQTLFLNGTTRAVPSDPQNPINVSVSTVSQLQSALTAAQPGTIITLANGTYSGNFSSFNSGTAANPIVIRGASEDGVILDGGSCIPCNVIEIYGSGYVHLEQMTIQNGERALRFQTSGSIGNVVRRVHTKNTVLGIGGQSNHLDFYIADNILEGRLTWPHVNGDDNGLHASDDGVAVFGFGHVVAHNTISGFGDAMKTEQDGARAIDFYGNDILFTYDNGIELDGSEGNTRCFRNRFTNTFATISFQPIHGGPAYAFRNVVVNVVTEQMKFHALAITPPQEPSGVLVYNNTFVSSSVPSLFLETPATSHYFDIENNLFVSPPSQGPVAGDWEGPIDHGTFDYNSYFPDGIFRFNNPLFGGYFLQSNFAGLQSLGMEPHGHLANAGMFANGLTGPLSYTTFMSPSDVTLAPNSNVVDKGRIIPNISDNYIGAGPDIGALELGCPEATYGPRPVGIDETNEITGCTSGITSVAVAPASVTLSASQTQQFNATTTPGGGAVVWSISPSRGTVTTGGLYRAPADAKQGELITVTAAGATSPTILATASVSISLPVTPNSVRGFIDTPALNVTLNGTVSIAGWAVTNTSASAPDAISSVKVFVDGNQVGTATYGNSRPDVCAAFPGSASCPNVGWSYSLNVGSLASGNHVLKVTATDTANNSFSTQVSFLANPQSPSVLIDSPVANAVLNGTVAIAGWAIESINGIGVNAINSVSVFVDGNPVGTATYGVLRADVCTAFPGRPSCPNVGWNYNLNASTLTAGSHTLKITATDTANNSFSSQVSFLANPQSPSVFIDSPVANAVLNGTVAIAGWAIESISGVGANAINSVSVFVDGNPVGTATYGVLRADVCAAFPGRPSCPNVGWNYNLNVSPLTTGSHTLKITATDTANNSSSSQVSFLANPQSPSVFIDLPIANAVLNGTVAIAGWAIESVNGVGANAISSVKVLVDGNQVGTAAYGVPRPDVCVVFPGRVGCPNVGWNYSLNAAAFSSGSHILQIVATDTAGTSSSQQTPFLK